MRDPGAQPVGRLTKRREFLAAALGRRFHTERMTVQGLVRQDADGSAPGLRVGLTVTKKVGHATERNRIRRRLRTAVADAAVDHRDANADVVVIGRRPALGAPHGLLVEDLRRALAAVTRPGPARKPAERPNKPDKPRAKLTDILSTDGERRGPPHA